MMVSGQISKTSSILRKLMFPSQQTFMATILKRDNNLNRSIMVPEFVFPRTGGLFEFIAQNYCRNYPVWSRSADDSVLDNFFADKCLLGHKVENVKLEKYLKVVLQV